MLLSHGLATHNSVYSCPSTQFTCGIETHDSVKTILMLSGLQNKYVFICHFWKNKLCTDVSMKVNRPSNLLENQAIYADVSLKVNRPKLPLLILHTQPKFFNFIIIICKTYCGVATHNYKETGKLFNVYVSLNMNRLNT